MAKIKTVEEIKEEAKKVMQEAKKKQKELLKEAAQLRQKNICELGDKCLEFLEEKIDINTLKTFAFNSALLNVEEKNSFSDKAEDESKNNSIEV